MSEPPDPGPPQQWPGQQPWSGPPQQPWSGPPQQPWPGQPPLPPSAPPKKRHRVRNGIIIGAAVLVIIIIASAIGSSGNGHKSAASSSAPAVTTSSAPAVPGRAAFYSDVQAQFPQIALAGSHSITSFGQDLCAKREQGVGQQQIITAMQKSAESALSGTNMQKLLRLAEKDLCPDYLVPVIAVAKPKPHVIATFTGSGIQNTARFTIEAPGDWVLKWSFDCSSYGYKGNFIVDEDNGSDFNGASVNELSMGGHGKTHVYGDTGRHFLSMNSECSWTVKVVQ